MLITENHWHMKNSVFQPTPYTTKSGEREIPPVRHSQQTHYIFCGVLWSNRDVEDKTCWRVRWYCLPLWCEHGAAWHRSESGIPQLSMKGGIACLSAWAWQCFPYLKGESLHRDFFVSLKPHTCKPATYTQGQHQGLFWKCFKKIAEGDCWLFRAMQSCCYPFI